MEKILKITKLDHQGRGIGKVDDKIIFVPYTLPDDEIKFKITKEKKNFCEGKVTEYIKKSSRHIDQTCPYYGICGGCDLRHMDYNQQLNFKQNKVKEIINKFTNIETIKINNIISSKNIDSYRNKITFKINKKLCLNKKATHEYVEIKACKLVNDKVNNIIKLINNYDLKNIDNVVIKSSYFTDDIMTVFYVKQGVKFTQNLDELKKIVTTIIFKYKNNDYIIYGKGNILEKLKNLYFKISPTSFFQINSHQTVNLYDLILQKCKLNGNEIVYDLYCGTGTIGLFLSQFCKKVIGIEINKEAILDAKENARINNIKNCEFYDEDVSSFVARENNNPDVIIVDPPRSGLDNITIDNVIRLNPKKIIYVSCDPVTLARDLNSLTKNYNIDEITPVDMFPNTYHVECVCVLNRR